MTLKVVTAEVSLAEPEATLQCSLYRCRAAASSSSLHHQQRDVLVASGCFPASDFLTASHSKHR